MRWYVMKQIHQNNKLGNLMGTQNKDIQFPKLEQFVCDGESYMFP